METRSKQGHYDRSNLQTIWEKTLLWGSPFCVATLTLMTDTDSLDLCVARFVFACCPGGTGLLENFKTRSKQGHYGESNLETLHETTHRQGFPFFVATYINFDDCY